MEVYSPFFKSTYDDYSKRQSDLDSLKTIAQRFSTVEEFLTELTLESPNKEQGMAGERADTLTLSTIHSAKGLEWDTVFVISVVDGYLPSFRSMDDLASLEEERRLLYVAMTRAKTRLFLLKPYLEPSGNAYYASLGMTLTKRSRFLDEVRAFDELTETWALDDSASDGRLQMWVEGSQQRSTQYRF